MTAADRLRALDEAMPAAPWSDLRSFLNDPLRTPRALVALRNALPALIALVEAAEENVRVYDLRVSRGVTEASGRIAWIQTRSALRALDAALGGEEE